MRALRSLLPVLVLAACGSGDADPTLTGPRISDAYAFANGWIGDYFGNGSGMVDGHPFEVASARLQVSFDADTVRLAGCPACITLQLDSIFALANVQASDPAVLDLSYDDGPVRYRMELLRFSGAGGVGNVASARVTIGNIGVETPFFDVTYLLERP